MDQAPLDPRHSHPTCQLTSAADDTYGFPRWHSGLVAQPEVVLIRVIGFPTDGLVRFNMRSELARPTGEVPSHVYWSCLLVECVVTALFHVKAIQRTL